MSKDVTIDYITDTRLSEVREPLLAAVVADLERTNTPWVYYRMFVGSRLEHVVLCRRPGEVVGAVVRGVSPLTGRPCDRHLAYGTVRPGWDGLELVLWGTEERVHVPSDALRPVGGGQ